ncbi:ATP synthase F0 sector subunit b [hydrothermal vent metagenome]|uniref:ATP synthase F0 sector subunit b n=1 Tax=hydrothermal vent metagenome TaxID=652676 RepID=A0A3B0WHV0_9ZZZZ
MNINATLIGQSIAFFVFVWFVMKFVWPPLIVALDQRKKTIADGLAAAERGMHEQELAEKAAEVHIKEAKVQASEIVTQAQKRASEIVEEAKDNAKEEAGRVKTAADAEIEQEISRAKEYLRQQVASIAIAGAEKVLKREIDVKAHSAIVDDMIAQI